MNLADLLSHTRGEIVAAVRANVCTVADLARRLDISENAVRVHVAALEADGILAPSGHRPSARRPAQTYRLTDSAEAFYARAYEPVLVELVRVLATRESPEALEGLLSEVGVRLGSGLASGAPDLETRVAHAAAVLTALGAVIETQRSEASFELRGMRCPLASLMTAVPQACSLGVGLVSAIVGRPVEERCIHEPFPACRFRIAREPAA